MFKFFHIRAGSAFCASLILPAAVSAQEEPGTDQLEELLAQIRASDPAIEAARLRWEAVQDEIPARGTRSDPPEPSG